MTFTMRKILGTLALGLAALCTGAAQAGPYSAMYVFGDSLSDTGNVQIATGGAQPPAGQPYFNGRFSDGLLWIDHLATGLGLPAGAAPALAGGNNFAFAGARTGVVGSPPGVLAQVAGMYLPAVGGVSNANALYVVVGGGNDMRDARTTFSGNSAADQAGRQAAADAAVANLFQSIALLAGSGAQHILMANLPDLGLTPEAAFLGVQSASSDASLRFNTSLLAMELLAEATFGIEIDMLDFAGIALAVRNDALNNGGAVYGITNATMPCAGFAFSAGAACNVSAFSDALHPSARMGQIAGTAALMLVPEPASAWLVLAAFGGLLVQRRRAALSLA